MINYLELLSLLCSEFEHQYNSCNKDRKVGVTVKTFQTHRDITLEVRFNLLVVFRQTYHYSQEEDFIEMMGFYNHMAKRMINDMVFRGMQASWDDLMNLKEDTSK